MRAANVEGPEQPAGLQPKEWPWTSIGRLNIDTVGYCTGALISPDQVLTARHCLDNRRTGRLVAPRQVFFLAGYARGEFAERAAVDHFELPAPPPEDQKETPTNDWVILRLTKPMDLQPIPVALLTPETIQSHAKEGTRFFRVGYPRERPHMLRLQAGCQISGMGVGGLAVTFDCSVMAGESGGPILMECQGQWRIVAMTIAYFDLDKKTASFGITPKISDVGLESGAAVCPAA